MHGPLHHQLKLAETAIANTLADAVMQERLGTFGYHPDRLEEGRLLYGAAEVAFQQQQIAYGNQVAATDHFRAAWKAARTVYQLHVRVARLALATDREANRSLDLGRREHRFAAWLVQAEQFYANLATAPSYQEALAHYGIAEAQLLEGQKLIAGASQARRDQELRKSEARTATRARIKAFTAMQRWFTTFFQVARVALADQPEELVKLGIDSYAKRRTSSTDGDLTAEPTLETLSEEGGSTAR